MYGRKGRGCLQDVWACQLCQSGLNVGGRDWRNLLIFNDFAIGIVCGAGGPQADGGFIRLSQSVAVFDQPTGCAYGDQQKARS
jgi:hypothetical protein